MTPDRLRSITATCLITCTIGFLTFVYLKNRNDSSIAKDTKRLAVAAEISVGMALEHEERRNKPTFDDTRL